MPRTESTIRPIADNPKDALAAYIKELSEDYYTWYATAVERNHWMWVIAQTVAVAAGFITAIIAALLREEPLRNSSVLGWSLIVIPVIGSLASTFLVQTRMRNLMGLRERGRERIQALITQARAEYAAASSPERFTKIHRDINVLVSRVEQEQTIGFFSIVPEMTLPAAQSDQLPSSPATS
jgi:hypothetical protein